MLPNWTQTDYNGIHVYRTDAGADKPTLVLLHGFSDNGLCWAPVARELEAAYNILVPEARAHGNSARVERGQYIDQVEDLASTLRACGIERAIVGGHSMGAGMAASLAVRYPEMVSALLLEDPPWRLEQPGHPPQERIFDEESPIADWLRGLQSQSLEAAVAQCRTEHPTWPDEYLRAWTEGKQQLDLKYLAAKNTAMVPWSELVPNIHCPVLLITADPAMEAIVTPELAAEICAANPKVKVVNFPGIGHHIRFAAHDSYMQAVRSFLAEL